MRASSFFLAVLALVPITIADIFMPVVVSSCGGPNALLILDNTVATAERSAYENGTLLDYTYFIINATGNLTVDVENHSNYDMVHKYIFFASLLLVISLLTCSCSPFDLNIRRKNGEDTGKSSEALICESWVTCPAKPGPIVVKYRLRLVSEAKFTYLLVWFLKPKR